ncbi:hypothetical protein EVAR_96495_1 [Eumeta japonica]|uniref:Uncharacterized protein n=1 Tax=Eumeta variegata TaxID=151549 RepID=A0A4C1ZXB1_EUMVA|nr:hypothetical protein EVAR_96495_1 [Eumeta japonica]
MTSFWSSDIRPLKSHNTGTIDLEFCVTISRSITLSESEVLHCNFPKSVFISGQPDPRPGTSFCNGSGSTPLCTVLTQPALQGEVKEGYYKEVLVSLIPIL